MYNITYINTIGVNMGLLEYTSDEMFSSTELVRKSKMIFDKLNDNDIEKAIILRDGKPSFMLYDFKRYEKLIKEHLEMKKELENLKSLNTIDETLAQKEKQIIEDEIKPIKDSNEISEIDEIDNDELSNALAQIDNMDFTLNKEEVEKKAEPLKEFWD